jgi:demethylspheroidene O-methyltransferase
VSASLAAAWQTRRDAWLTSQRFQQWAIRWPVLRWIARRRAAALFDLCAGFVYSQVLRATVDLELCEMLTPAPLPVAEIARRTGLDRDATERLVAGAASLRLVELRGRDLIGVGSLGAALVGNSMIRAMVEHHSMLYRDLADPVARLRDRSLPGELRRYWAYASMPAADVGPAATSAYSTLMSASQAMVAEEILAAFPVRRLGRCLDVGGGNGELLIRLAQQVPGFEGSCFDLPAVAAQAATRVAALGLDDRIRVFGGDVLSETLPPDHDAALLVRVLHDHDDAAARQILAAVRRALPADGRLLIAEPLAEPPGRNRVADAYFGMYLLAMGQGRTRSKAELAAMLEEAGFGPLREYRTRLPMLLRVLVVPVDAKRVNHA